MSLIKDSLIIDKKSKIFYVEVFNEQYGRYMRESELLDYSDAVFFASKVKNKYRGIKVVCEVLSYT